MHICVGLRHCMRKKKPFLKKREAACVVLTRMRAFLQAGLVGVDKAGAAPLREMKKRPCQISCMYLHRPRLK